MQEENLLDKLQQRTHGATIGHAMTNLWRRVLKENGLVEQTNGMLANYNKRYRNSKNSRELINSSTMKANCFNDEISLKSLIGLIKNLLNVRKIDFTITITHNNGVKRHHSETLFDKRKESND